VEAHDLGMTHTTRPLLRSALGTLAALTALALPLVAPAGQPTASAAPLATRGQAMVKVRELLDGTIQRSYYHSAGGSVTVARPAPGSWTIRISGFVAPGGNAQLTQYIMTGEGGRSFCAIAGWAPVKGAMEVHVKCWGDTGKPPTQTSFGVLFNSSLVLPSTLYAAFTAPNGAFVGTVTPPVTWRIGAAPTVKHLTAGHYLVEYPLAASTPFPVVTAISTVPRVCNIAGWKLGFSTTHPGLKALFVGVACFDFLGVARDTAFSFMMSNRNPLGVNGGSGGRIVVGNSATVSTTPVANNVNTRSGAVVANNSYRTVSTAPIDGATYITMPGYPGAIAILDRQLDVAVSVGNDGTRCALEDSPLRYNGVLTVLLLCTRPNGTYLVHAANVGSWTIG
jgi:hypothetical protein